MGSVTKYLRADPQVYEAIRAYLDDKWGYPNPAVKTESCLPPVGELPSKNGLVHICLSSEYLEYADAAELLEDMFRNGDIVEITEQEYESLFQNEDLP